MVESDPKEQGTPQERLEDHAVGSDSDDPQAETGADSARDAEKETQDDQ